MVTSEQFHTLGHALIRGQIDELKRRLHEKDENALEVLNACEMFHMLWISMEEGVELDTLDLRPLAIEASIPGIERFATHLEFNYLHKGTEELYFGWSMGHHEVEGNLYEAEGWTEFDEGLDQLITDQLVLLGFSNEQIVATMPERIKRRRADRMESALQKQLSEQQEKLIAEARAEMDQTLRNLFGEGG